MARSPRLVEMDVRIPGIHVSREEKSMAKKKKKKRKASKTLKAWSKCYKETGVCPMFGVSDVQKAKVRACVDRRLGKKRGKAKK